MRHQGTEFVTSTGEKLDGPHLPEPLEGHAMVRINSTHTLITGRLSYSFVNMYVVFTLGIGLDSSFGARRDTELCHLSLKKTFIQNVKD